MGLSTKDGRDYEVLGGVLRVSLLKSIKETFAVHMNRRYSSLTH